MKEIVIHVYRGDKTGGKFVTYKVPHQPGMVVLTAVQYIQQWIDTDLGARWNCRAGKCGSCGAEINGRPKLMCKTKIDEIKGDIYVKPFQAFPLQKDLVADVSSNYEKAKTIIPFQSRDTSMPYIMHQEDVERSLEFRKCIECFICQDVCHAIREHQSDYIGPRYIVKTAYLDMHPLDKFRRSRFLKDKAKIGYCNITKCCQELCPEEIKITDNAIIPEKERVADDFYDMILRFFKKRPEQEIR